MSLEQYMHSFDVYLSVSIISSPSLPVKAETVTTLEQNIRPLYLEIEAIMRRHNLNVTSTTQCGNMSKAKYPGGDTRPRSFWVISHSAPEPDGFD
ncbi:uncharacterized protein N7487_008446 [Penicillium crustosum]|uniref:uncharacterized protein n=1 Tax=Penicillium crustosum TaxID=36656 RepID=UPI00239575FF|nr:uncharacterized protein N7487_008446 [Penicillium crustosum]KAJ5402550.1 hypothetical protein N7487_008446 [Penicillium crustosum]